MVDRKANLGLVSCQQLVFQRAYKLGFLFTVFTKDFESLFSDITSVFAAIKKKFWALKFTFDLVFSRVWKIKEK